MGRENIGIRGMTAALSAYHVHQCLLDTDRELTFLRFAVQALGQECSQLYESVVLNSIGSGAQIFWLCPNTFLMRGANFETHNVQTSEVPHPNLSQFYLTLTPWEWLDSTGWSGTIRRERPIGLSPAMGNSLGDRGPDHQTPSPCPQSGDGA
jgi:hypothetical protein